MKFLYYFGFRGGKSRKAPATLAEFLLHTPRKEKIELFTKAAHKANEDQRATFNRAQAVH